MVKITKTSCIMLILGGEEKERLGFLLVQQNVVWSLWISHNVCIFLVQEIFVFKLVDMVNFTCWKWFLGKYSSHIYSFYERDHKPILC